MQIIKLPIVRSPICSLQYLAFPLVIVLNNDNSPWFLSNYIQLEAPKEGLFDTWGCNVTFSGGWFPNVPCLEYHIMERPDFFKLPGNTVSKFNEYLKQGWYVEAIFDEYFIPRRRSYKSNHFLHDFLLYETDMDKEQFTIIGYNDKRLFSESTVDFNAFTEAFECQIKENCTKVNILRLNQNFKSQFNLRQVFELLDEYLNSKDSSYRYEYNTPENNYLKVYGLEVYDFTISFFENLLTESTWSDIRPLCVLHEHKTCMLIRLKYMIENRYISISDDLLAEFVKIENDVIKMRNIQLKYNITKNTELIKAIISRLKETRSKEKNAIECLLNTINSTLEQDKYDILSSKSIKI
jgi:hypothetical protein